MVAAEQVVANLDGRITFWQARRRHARVTADRMVEQAATEKIDGLLDRRLQLTREAS